MSLSVSCSVHSADVLRLLNRICLPGKAALILHRLLLLLLLLLLR
jgi:hypothetical protein